MLSHEIIKVKEKYTPSPPWSGSGIVYANKSKVVDQASLDEFLAQALLPGVFVRYNNGQISIHSPHQLNVVLCVQRNFNKVKIGYTNHPETHLLLQCVVTGTPWMRWVSPQEYTEVSDADKARFVDAKLLNYIEETKQSSEMYKEATT